MVDILFFFFWSDFNVAFKESLPINLNNSRMVFVPSNTLVLFIYVIN